MSEIRRKRELQSMLAFCLVSVGLYAGQAQTQNRNPADAVVTIDGRAWALETSGAALPWAEANEFCDTLEAGGFSDWRLPTLAELERIHDPAAESSIRGPFDLEDCCAWSSINLVALTPERKGQLPEQSGAPEGYYWGFLFDGGVSYYSNGRFADGFAMCTRGPANDP
jgi:hypothetical protein